MSSEIIQSVAYDNDNYDDFQHDNFIFSQNFMSLFGGLFNGETDLRGKVFGFSCTSVDWKHPLHLSLFPWSRLK
jgi:hypothetical protein